MPRPSPQTERVLAAINALAVRPDGLSLTELSRTIGANTASCVHMLAAMADAGFVVRDATTKRYAVGPALIVPGQAAAARYPALGAARREADELVRTLGVVCFVMAREGAETRLVHRAWDPRDAPPTMQLGDALPLVPPLGSVFVAWADDEEVEEWLSRGAVDARARAHARRVLDAARRHGFVVELVPSEPLLHELGRLLARTRTGGGRGARVRSVDDTFVLEHLDPDAEHAVSSIGAPVFDADGAVHLVLSSLGLPARLTGREVARIGRAVRAAADRATESSGAACHRAGDPRSRVRDAPGRRPDGHDEHEHHQHHPPRRTPSPLGDVVLVGPRHTTPDHRAPHGHGRWPEEHDPPRVHHARVRPGPLRARGSGPISARRPCACRRPTGAPSPARRRCAHHRPRSRRR